MRSNHGDTPQAAVFKSHKVNLKTLKLFWGMGTYLSSSALSSTSLAHLQSVKTCALDSL